MDGNTTDPLYWSDFMIETDAYQCHFCGDIGPEIDGEWVRLDQNIRESFVCLLCLDGYDWKHHQP